MVRKVGEVGVEEEIGGILGHVKRVYYISS